MGAPGRGLPRTTSVSHFLSFHPLWRSHENPSPVDEVELETMMGKKADAL